VTDPDDPPPTDSPSDSGVALAVDRLGEPAATYTVSPVLFWGKLALGLTLVLCGILATVLWFTLAGWKNFGHLQFHLLFWPTFLGGMLLVHLVRHRGVKVLVFPTGLLHLRPGKVESFPWDEVKFVTVKAGAGTAVVVKDGAGDILSAWVAVPTTVVQVWNTWFRLARADGATATFTPVLAGYPDLAREVQAETFTRLWPGVRAAFLAGHAVPFGVLTVSETGISMGKKTIAWGEVKKLTPSQKLLSIERKGGWVPWLAVPMEQVSNPHLFFAVAHLATRGGVGGEK
jgi:hypothetical protein